MPILETYLGLMRLDQRRLIVIMSMQIVEYFLLIGALIAAAAVALVCGLGLVVWLAGGQFYSRFK